MSMVICHRCGKENQDHYKFCLGCGAELSAPEPQGDVGTMNTIMADQSTPTPPPNTGAPLPGVPVAQAAPAAQPAPAPAQPAAPVQPVPAQSSAPPAAQPRPSTVAGPGTAGPRACPSCGAEVAPSFKFCGECGFKMPTEEVTAGHTAPASEPPATAKEPAAASMTLIRPDGSEGDTVELQAGENKIGRNHGAVFANDGYLSPEHCLVTIEGDQATVVDAGSLNGVFVKMAAEEEVENGQIFRLGQELLRFETLSPPTPLDDGTEIMGSPNPGYWGRITVMIGREIDGSSFPLLSDNITLGRERGDINFSDDGYVSGLHSQVARRGGKFYLSDLGSSNGTFIRLSKPRTLASGAFVLLGQQLFRLNIPG